MAEFAEIDIQSEINDVRTAYKGSEVRDSIADGLKACQDGFNAAVGQFPTIAEQFICGRETLTASAASTMLNTTLNLPFTPTENTQVIATLRRQGTPTPYLNYCLTLSYDTIGAPKIYAIICAGQNGSGMPESTIAAGTYYIDWLVLDKGTTE